MGHKKRNSVPPRSKLSPAASPVNQSPIGGAATATTTNGSTSPDADNSIILFDPNPNKIEFANNASPQSEASHFSAIKVECERALTTFRRGNHNRAMKLMKELCLKEEGSFYSPFVHRIYGFICFKVASVITDCNAKQRHLKHAVELARRAVELSPNSVEYAHFHASVMLEAATEAKDYEDVVHECERGLAIEYPTDPAKETLQDESEQKVSSMEDRILHVQGELRQLIQKSNIASLSSWMKNLSNGEERFRLIPIRRATEDPMEVRLVQTRRPNEIKKVTKTPEERRKEIEVRVAAARLLQQKSESPQSPNEVDREDRALDLNSGSSQRTGERRRHLRKNGSTAERRKWVLSYWDSVGMDVKKDLLKIKISDIVSHFNSTKDTLLKDVLSEALSYAEANKTWRFWSCCICSERFSNQEFQRQHVMQVHLQTLPPKMQRILPQHVDNEWIEMILNCSWKPLDVSAAVKMLDHKAKFRGSSRPEDYLTQDYNDCFKDSNSSYHEQESLGYSAVNCTTESSKCYKIDESDVREGIEDQQFMANPVSDCWPVSDDEERAQLLEKIHGAFEILIRYKCLAAGHLHKVIQFSISEIQGLAAGSELLKHDVDQTDRKSVV